MSRDRFKHGLVIGKFYPPHLGHEYLIRTAAAHSLVVTVVVLGSSAETLSIAQRVLWLRDSMADARHVRIVGELDDVPVNYADENIWQEHVSIMRQGVAQADRVFGVQAEVDAVFSSELYGERLAVYFKSQHICLDQSRVLYPTSGTAVRADVIAQWHMLSPAVQAGLVMRVVALGAESSGTTTLSRDLAASLRDRNGVWARTQWVAEYGREYSANLLALARATNSNATAYDIEWNSEDFVQVASEQCRREDQAARLGSPVLICDTDALATCVWHERYMGGANPAVNDIAANLVPRALYILTSEKGVPFEDDGLRDGEHLRPWMTGRFRDVLNQQAVPWIEVSGTQEERLLKALDAIESQMGHHWTYSHPLLEANTKSD